MSKHHYNRLCPLVCRFVRPSSYSFAPGEVAPCWSFALVFTAWMFWNVFQGWLTIVFPLKTSQLFLSPIVTQNHIRPLMSIVQYYARHKKRDTFKLLLHSFLWLKIKKIGEIRKELDKMKRMRPTGTFFHYLFRSYSSLKITCLKMKCKNRIVLLFLDFNCICL
mgnify:CR=1 FL=1